MIQVTNNDVYVEYPTDRHVSFEYEEVINAMQPLPPPPIPDNLKQAVEAARKVIWVEQDDGTHARPPFIASTRRCSSPTARRRARPSPPRPGT